MHQYQSLLKDFLMVRVHSYRLTLQCSQERMAEKLRISPRSYIDLERGKYGFSAATFAFFLLILPEDDVLNILMTFAGDPISTMQPLIDLLKTLDGDVEKLDQRIAVRKSALGVVGENLGTDNQYSSESKTIESDLSIVASLR